MVAQSNSSGGGQHQVKLDPAEVLRHETCLHLEKDLSSFVCAVASLVTNYECTDLAVKVATTVLDPELLSKVQREQTVGGWVQLYRQVLERALTLLAEYPNQETAQSMHATLHQSTLPAELSELMGKLKSAASATIVKMEMGG